MYEVDPEFAPDRLEKGRVYRFKARNFFHGVWDGAGGFIGIREKFGDLYLFTEYHAMTGGQFGTVWNISATEHVAPPDVEIEEGFTRCDQCQQDVEWARDNPPHVAPGHWVHVDRALDEDHLPDQPSRTSNTALGAFLAPLWEREEEGLEAYRDYIVAWWEAAHAGDSERAAELQRAEMARRRASRPW